MDDLYREIILENAQSPQKFGHLDHFDLSGDAKNASCGDSLLVEVALDEKGGVSDVAWTGEGCAISMATASLVAQKSIGQNLKDLQKMELPQVLEVLGLENISPARIKCAMLFVNGLRNLK